MSFLYVVSLCTRSSIFLSVLSLEGLLVSEFSVSLWQRRVFPFRCVMCHMSCCCRRVWTSVAFWTCLFFFFLVLSLSLFLSLLHGRSELNDRFSFYFVNSLKEEESAPQMPLSKAHPLRDIHAFRSRKLTFSVLSGTENLLSPLSLFSSFPPFLFIPVLLFSYFLFLRHAKPPPGTNVPTRRMSVSFRSIRQSTRSRASRKDQLDWMQHQIRIEEVSTLETWNTPRDAK